MTFKEIQQLIKQINETNLTEFKLKEKEFELLIRTKSYFKRGETVLSQPLSQQVVAVPPTTAPALQQQETFSPAKDKSSENAGEAGAKKMEEQYLEVKSPIVGTFYRASSPDKPPYVKVGDTIEKGTIVCIVEAMKLFNEIESEISGKIVKVMVEDAQPVEFDQVLFLLEPM